MGRGHPIQAMNPLKSARVGPVVVVPADHGVEGSHRVVRQREVGSSAPFSVFRPAAVEAVAGHRLD